MNRAQQPESSRDRILQAVRAARPPAKPLPDLVQLAQAFPHDDSNHVVRFIESARQCGATVIERDRAHIEQAVTSAYPLARRIRWATSDAPATVPAESPHALADLDLLVCEGVLGVAENGAIWLPVSRLGERSALFLATHVVILLAQRAIVPDFYQAYAQLNMAAESYGVFVAGPSKTADIEQALVIGAQGAVSLTIVLLSDA